MLPLRTAIFAAVAAVSLWALFSLLENLREPGLLRSGKAIVVKGCDGQDLAPVCFQLFCQKALLDAKHAPLGAKFEPGTERRAGSRRLLLGRAVSDQGARDFACAMRGTRVMAARPIEPEEIQLLLASEPDDWSL